MCENKTWLIGLALLLSMQATPILGQGVVLWNKLGNDLEATNSAFGPALTRQGTVNYESGKFGNGVRMDGSYPGYFLLDESMIDNLIIARKGTMSVWVKTNWASTDNTYAHIFFDTSMGGGDGRMSMGAVVQPESGNKQYFYYYYGVFYR